MFLEFKGEVNANLTHTHSLPRSSRVLFSSLSFARSLCPSESFSPIALPLSLSSVRALARAVSGCVDFCSLCRLYAQDGVVITVKPSFPT